MSDRQLSPFLSTKSRSLVFRSLPHKYKRFANYIAEMRSGKYIEKHFNEMLDQAEEWIVEEPTDKEKWENVVGRMEKFLERKRSSGQADANQLGDKGELFSISNYYRSILSCGYYKQDSVKPAGLGNNIGDFHIHNDLEQPSKADMDLAKYQPELVIIYKKSFLTNVKFVYLFPQKQNKNKRVRVGQFKFGPFKI